MSNDTSRTQTPRRRIEDSDIARSSVLTLSIALTETTQPDLQEKRGESKHLEIPDQNHGTEANDLSRNPLVDQHVDDSSSLDDARNIGVNKPTTPVTPQNQQSISQTKPPLANGEVKSERVLPSAEETSRKVFKAQEKTTPKPYQNKQSV